MKKILSPAYLLIFTSFFYSCNAQQKNSDLSKSIQNQFSEEFKNYWFQGKAEISSYELQQARYGEMREGEAVLVYVTEDFLVEKQVKKESNTSSEATSILKLNLLRKFPTGIYDYSMMTSTFTPVTQNESINPLKLTTSSQEWCGHSWLQLNQKSKQYLISSFSYFQSEGDVKKQVDLQILEDGFWSQIRMNPNKIPLGEMMVFPSTQYLRLSHKELKAYEANVSLSPSSDTSFSGDNPMSLIIKYPSLERTMTIVFEKEFPHQIIGWKEERKSGFGLNAKALTTRAKLKSKMLSPYWEKNSNQDDYLRDSLKLKF